MSDDLMQFAMTFVLLLASIVLVLVTIDTYLENSSQRKTMKQDIEFHQQQRQIMLSMCGELTGHSMCVPKPERKPVL